MGPARLGVKLKTGGGLERGGRYLGSTLRYSQMGHEKQAVN